VGGRAQPDIARQVELPELAGRFPLTVQTIIYRLVEEALTNIGKHATPAPLRVPGWERIIFQGDLVGRINREYIMSISRPLLKSSQLACGGSAASEESHKYK
jgi:hypothetical protein